VSYVVTREIDRRYHDNNKGKLENNPEDRMMEMLKELEDE